MKSSATIRAWTNCSRRKIHVQWAIHFIAVTLTMWFAALSPLAAQLASSDESHPPIVYVGTAGGGITEVNTANNLVVATAPFPNNANSVAITPDGRRMYASNRDVGEVTVFDTATNVPLTTILVGNGSDNLGLAVSPDGNLVYVANQASGTVTVIYAPTNKVEQVIPTGLEPIWVTFSHDGSRAYVSNQVSGSISIIATASGSVVGTIWGFSCPFESVVTHDGSRLLVSSQCDSTLKVVNLATNMIVNSIPTGPNPRGIALTPDGSRAYVADWFSNTVDVIDVLAQKNLNTPITVGANPWGITMTPQGNAYTANFGDATISVINTSTNRVTATLPSRSYPEEVAVSTTPRPRILNYLFVRFDVSGATDTFARGLNNRSQNVGSFVDTGGVEHGYLRQPDGSFVTLDPPGSVGTVAAGVNDLGMIVGTWTDNGGAAHGFTRGPAGTYTTLDFPGATDTSLTGIDDVGRIVGAYDLGDPSTSIGFVYSRGQFTSFEDPSAVPAQTTPAGINLLGLISGVYLGTDGFSHGFVRDPKGQFHDYDFPGAGNTIGTRINDKGQVIGNYSLHSIGHGFILSSDISTNEPPSPGQFFSFDYPNSQVTAGRGSNDLGQFAGWFFLPGDPVRHSFLATPRSE